MTKPVANKNLSSEAWELHKRFVESYLSNGVLHKDLPELMARERNFHASKAQYERQLKKWNFCKYRNKDHWKAIGYHVGKRKRDGKDSDVYEDDSLLPEPKVRKEIARYTSTVDLFTKEPSPPLPDNIAIYTPQTVYTPQADAPSWVLTSPIANLPCVEFFRSISVRDNNYSVISDFSFSGSSTNSGDLVTSRAPESVGLALMSSWLAAPAVARSNPGISKLRALGAELWTEDESSVIRDLHNPATKAVAWQQVQTAIYLISNNLVDSAKKKQIVESLALGYHTNILRALLQMTGPTTEALVAAVFSNAVEFRNMCVVRAVLNAGFKPDTVLVTSCLSKTPLKYAAYQGDVELARVLIAGGADINYSPDTPAHWSHPLHCAVDSSKEEIVKLLLDAGADVNVKNANGDTPLHSAAGSSKEEIVRLLLDAGADIDDMTKSGSTPLHSAVSACREDIVKLLLDAGANVDDMTKAGYTPLDYAVLEHREDIVELLLDAGADVNMKGVKGSTPLHLCVDAYDDDDSDGSYHSEILSLLLERGADVDAKDDEGNTPLHYAIQNNYVECTRLLLAELVTGLRGGESKARNLNNHKIMIEACIHELTSALREVNMDSHNTETESAVSARFAETIQILLDAGCPVGGALSYVPDGYDELFQILLDASDDINCYSYDGWTALAKAAYDGNMNRVKLLLARGADIEGYVPSCDLTPIFTLLQAAAQSGNIELTHLLHSAGGDINSPATKIGGRTALQGAIENGHYETAAYLIDSGADIDGLAAESEGVTALSSAINTENMQLVMRLLDLGVDVNNPSAKLWGQTALEAAVRRGNQHLIRQLLSVGADPNDPIALLVAVDKRDMDIVQILLGGYARLRVSKIVGYGALALQHAIYCRHMDFVQVLLDFGINVNLLVARYYLKHVQRLGMWPVEQIVRRNQPPLLTAVATGDITFVRILLQAGADPNIIPAATGVAPILEAVGKRRVDMVQALIDAGADINMPATFPRKRTPVQKACEDGNIDLADLLLQSGADVNSPAGPHRGVTALQAAAIGGYLGIVVKLIDQGADVNAPGSAANGRTALEGAAEHGRLDTVHFLLDSGALIEGPGRVQYDRALEFAEREFHGPVCSLLRAYHTRLHGEP
ncbi:hypothetical protein AJ80_07941 [Polytolypa hystricis UAMH7299]|uniref:Clr5 domain-containing protein n=1 Tax=Polytolypa hystricis (strain UAMH7299) TaxID=1447883 RepID=A0A2B7XGK1_POLH7|nr:hypothetical protein AJ80_07941 [Polytolypa hystricis UAMH7299]